MEVTPDKRDKLVEYFARVEYLRKEPTDVTESQTEEQIKTGGKWSYQNDWYLHKLVDSYVSAVIQIMEAE